MEGNKINKKKFIDSEKLNKIRVLLLGNKSVGKTSLINRYINHHFRKDSYSTKEIK